MKALVLSACIVAVLALAIWFEGCASVVETQSVSVLEASSVQSEDPFAGLPFMSPQESRQTCLELIRAAFELDLRCGSSLEELQEILEKSSPEETCQASPNFARSKAEFCMQSVQRMGCGDELPEVCLSLDTLD